MRFRDIPRPFLSCVLIDEPTPTALLRTMKLAEYDGADAFNLEIQTLAPEYRNVESLAPLFRATTRPIFTVYRRYTLRGSEFVPAARDEDERIKLQLDLIDHGSIGLDMELDTFDPGAPFQVNSDEGRRFMNDRSSPPREVSHNARAAERQAWVVEEAGRRGGEVLASAHTMTRLTPEATLAIGRLAEQRGAGAVKVVQFCASYEDVVESLETTVLLGRELSIPYVHMAMGEYGKLTRVMAPLLGSMLIFVRQDYQEGSFLDQPPLREMREYLSSVDFRITRRAEQFAPTDALAAARL